MSVANKSFLLQQVSNTKNQILPFIIPKQKNYFDQLPVDQQRQCVKIFDVWKKQKKQTFEHHRIIQIIYFILLSTDVCALRQYIPLNKKTTKKPYFSWIREPSIFFRNLREFDNSLIEYSVVNFDKQSKMSWKLSK